MSAFLEQCRFFFIYAGLFSFFANLLLLAVPLYMLQVFDRVLTSRSNETLVVLTVAAVGALMVMAALEILRSRLLVRVGVAIDKLLGEPVLAESLRNAVKPDGTPYGYGLRDVNTLRQFLTGNSVFAFFDAPWTPLFLVLIFVFHPLLGAIALLGMAVQFFLAYLEERTTRPPLETANAKQRVSGQFVEMSMRNAEVVNAMGMSAALASRWRKLNAEVIGLQTVASNRAGVIVATTRFVRTLLQVLMLAVGAYLIIDRNVTPGIMIAATIILGRAMAPVELAIGTWRNLVDARGAYRRLAKLLEGKAAVADKLELPPPAGHLKVERLVFGRMPSPAIIKGISFELSPGESLGLIGPSAAGKSTLARLIMGVWVPQSGVVRLDGADISAWDCERLGGYVGYLPQDVELFAGTVAENIARLGDPAANSEDVIKAAKLAHAHDMILHLPNGYDTEIGDGGAVLSGGQRQRVALARALFGSPRLVVLDEPNSNLDSEGEEGLRQTINDLKALGVTLIIIAHKPSLLAHVDKMLVLSNGQVDSFGTRQEVLARLARAGVVRSMPGTDNPE